MTGPVKIRIVTLRQLDVARGMYANCRRPRRKMHGHLRPFVALCAGHSGLPAREIFSIRLQRARGYYDMAALLGGVFLARLWWVPVDPADVRKAMLVEKIDINDAKTKAYRDYFWGVLIPTGLRSLRGVI